MDILTLLIVLAMAATAVTMLFGIGSMAHGGRFDQRHSHQIMLSRVGLQALTLLLLVLFLILR